MTMLKKCQLVECRVCGLHLQRTLPYKNPRMTRNDTNIMAKRNEII